MSCMDGEWYPLPSGRLVCHNLGVKYHNDAREDCNKVGGYLAEISHRDDMQTLLYIMWNSLRAGTKSSSRFRIGAITTGSQWR